MSLLIVLKLSEHISLVLLSDIVSVSKSLQVSDVLPILYDFIN